MLKLLENTIMPINEENLNDLNVIPPNLDNQIAIVFDNFLREEATLNLIKSIFTFAPGVKIYIGDQSIFHSNTNKLYQQLILNGHEIIYCGFDCGISVARNKAIQAVKEPYIFICDCDNLFTNNTDLSSMIKILDNNLELGLLSLYEYNNNELSPYEINLIRNNKILSYYLIPITDQIRKKEFFYCDYTMNVGLAKKELFEVIQYDESMKLAEHLDFFMQIKYNTSYKVGCATQVSIKNQNLTCNNPDYSLYRGRNKIYWQLYKNKWNLDVINNYSLILNKNIEESISVKKLENIDTIINNKEETIKDLLSFCLKNKIKIWLLNECCLETIMHKKITSNCLQIGVTNVEDSELIKTHLKKESLKIDIKIEPHRNTKEWALYGIPILVPCPLTRYIESITGKKWIDIEKKIKNES